MIKSRQLFSKNLNLHIAHAQKIKNNFSHKAITRPHKQWLSNDSRKILKIRGASTKCITLKEPIHECS